MVDLPGAMFPVVVGCLGTISRELVVGYIFIEEFGQMVGMKGISNKCHMSKLLDKAHAKVRTNTLKYKSLKVRG